MQKYGQQLDVGNVRNFWYASYQGVRAKMNEFDQRHAHDFALPTKETAGRKRGWHADFIVGLLFLLAGGIGSATPASALSSADGNPGNVFIGSCEIDPNNNWTDERAFVRVVLPGNVNGPFAGGSRYWDGSVQAMDTGSFTIDYLNDCIAGGDPVTGLFQNGADSAYATDDYIGFAFFLESPITGWDAGWNEIKIGTGSLIPSNTAAFEPRENLVRDIIRDQATDRLVASLQANRRMMMDLRDRLIAMSGGTSGDEDTAAVGLTGYAPLGVSGTIDARQDVYGMAYDGNGAFAGQTGFRDMVNWRLSGTFDVIANDAAGVLAAFDARVAREQMVGDGVLIGAYLGAEASMADIRDAFTGTQTGLGVFGGGYVAGRLADVLYADGFASIGYGQNDLNMMTDLGDGYDLSLVSTYHTLTWQIGGSLTGVIAMDGFEVRPNLAAAYGNTRLGDIALRADAYGLSDTVSIDAGNVEIGTLRFTPEIRVALGGDEAETGAAVLSVLPSLACEYERGTDPKSTCGGGGGLRLTSGSRDGYGEFGVNLNYERVGESDRYGGKVQYNRAF